MSSPLLLVKTNVSGGGLPSLHRPRACGRTRGFPLPSPPLSHKHYKAPRQHTVARQLEIERLLDTQRRPTIAKISLKGVCVGPLVIQKMDGVWINCVLHPTGFTECDKQPSPFVPVISQHQGQTLLRTRRTGKFGQFRLDVTDSVKVVIHLLFLSPPTGDLT